MVKIKTFSSENIGIRELAWFCIVVSKARSKHHHGLKDV
jgi:hypothetical protein